MLKATGVCFVAIFLAVVYAQPDVTFTVDVTGTFAESSNNAACPACDCPDIQTPCTYHNGFVCPQAESEGPDDNQVRWGELASGYTPFCFSSSGLGFQGKKGITMVANAAEDTIIGKITHYNNPIKAGTTKSTSPRYLQLKFTVNLAEIPDPFEIRYPLSFIETPNTNSMSGCDPAIQRTDVTCDDRLSFDAELLTDSFEYGSYRYTLSVSGFMQTGNTPIRAFITKERTASRANVYAKIITFCLESACGPNELFVRVPACQCICQLSNETCQRVFGEDWHVGTPSSGGGCNCVCGKAPTPCNGTDVWNEDLCACGCSKTDAQCAAENPLFGVSLDDECDCVCNKQKQMECNSINPYFRPVGDKCTCECFLNDTICVELFGEEFGEHDERNCACIAPPTPSEPDLTDEEIAGIVIATVLGSLLIGLFLLAILGVLVYLIMSGVIPGIYGYKIPGADLGAGSVNPGYASPWSDVSSALG